MTVHERRDLPDLGTKTKFKTRPSNDNGGRGLLLVLRDCAVAAEVQQARVVGRYMRRIGFRLLEHVRPALW